MELFYLFFCLSLTVAQSPVVNLDYASYRGRSLPNGVSQWLGMRFAAPPIGDLRFAAPEDPTTQQGVQNATNVCDVRRHLYGAEHRIQTTLLY
jgi:hypothetical protein